MDPLAEPVNTRENRCIHSKRQGPLMRYGRVKHLVHMHISESARVLHVRGSPTPVARDSEGDSGELRVLIIFTVSFQLHSALKRISRDTQTLDRPNEKAAKRAIKFIDRERQTETGKQSDTVTTWRSIESKTALCSPCSSRSLASRVQNFVYKLLKPRSF